jgi:hypothetical protein
MNRFARLAVVAALAGGLAAPAFAQDDVQAQGVIGDIIDKLIGHKYNVNDRKAVRQCGWAAVDKAERDYRRYFTGRPHAYPGYRGYVRVTAITDVQRRAKGVRVRGLLDTARYGYKGGRYGADLSFRCDTDRKGRVTDVRVERNPIFRTQ